MTKNYIDIFVPAELEGTKSLVRAWLRQPGDAIAKDDPLVELETDKVTMEVAAPTSGILAEIIAMPDTACAPGDLLGRLHLAAEVAHAAPVVPSAVASASVMPVNSMVQRGGIAHFDPALRLSPSVRRTCLTHGIDPRHIVGSGRGGRVTLADVEAALQRAAMPTPSPELQAMVIPHDNMRRRIAEHMVHSITTAPHVTAVFEADCSAIIAHRAVHKADFAAGGVQLTFSAYFIAAAAQAMTVVPIVNSRWHDAHVELFADVNIGIGTALGDKGLVVPVVHRAQALSLRAIAERLQDITTRARANKLTPKDMQGGTFSISNHGVSGSLLASPIIINQPQSAILGVGKLEKRVVVRTIDGVDSLQIRPMTYVSLTIDHRLLDGHQTNAWLTAFVTALENWA